MRVNVLGPIRHMISIGKTVLFGINSTSDARNSTSDARNSTRRSQVLFVAL